MDRIEYSYVDRSGWPVGPWDNEPFDKVQWPDAQTGLPCLAVRGPLGAWCGYVGLLEGHPYFGAPYDHCAMEVHGGLTFSGFCDLSLKEHGICHVPGAGESDNAWWLGFDCAHCYDVIPAYPNGWRVDAGAAYRTLEYVQAECAALAHQLAGKA